MARKYAAVMALVGMSVVLVRALRGGASVESAVMTALSTMAVMGLVGLVIGAVAQATIDEAVRSQMERDLSAIQRSPQLTM
jgi:hypothetical protein